MVGDRKIHSHRRRPGWGNEDNISNEISRLNTFIDSHPCFAPRARIQASAIGACLLIERSTEDNSTGLVIISNPTGERQQCQLPTKAMNTIGSGWQTLYGDHQAPLDGARIINLETWQPLPSVHQLQNKHHPSSTTKITLSGANHFDSFCARKCFTER